ncbi:MAG TPA: isochorismatase family protein [Gaiellales bacterium]
MSLIRRDASALLVIDTQEGFYPAARTDVDRAAFSLVVDRVAWLAALARALAVPVVVTEEDPGTNGPTAPRVVTRLPIGAVVLPKPVFAAGDDPAIEAAIAATGRSTIVLAGLETDVCVAHSALSLRERGYHVAAVSDALYSPSEAHRHGLARLRAEGVQLLSAKELLYDWARTLADLRALVRDAPELDPPPGFSL